MEDCVRREDIRAAEEVPLMTALDFERKWEARPCIPELVLLSLVGEVRGVADRDRGWDGRQDGRIWPPVTHKEVPRVVGKEASYLSCHTLDKGCSNTLGEERTSSGGELTEVGTVSGGVSTEEGTVSGVSTEEVTVSGGVSAEVWTVSGGVSTEEVTVSGVSTEEMTVSGGVSADDTITSEDRWQSSSGLGGGVSRGLLGEDRLCEELDGEL